MSTVSNELVRMACVAFAGPLAADHRAQSESVLCVGGHHTCRPMPAAQLLLAALPAPDHSLREDLHVRVVRAR